MLKRFLAAFRKKPEKPQKAPGRRNTGVSAKKISKLEGDLAHIKEHISGLPDHSEKLKEIHEKHSHHEKKLDIHSEKFDHLTNRMQDQKIDIIELKSKLNELSGSLNRFEPLVDKITVIEQKLIEKEAESVEKPRVAQRVERAKAAEGSLLEQYHSMAPSTKKIFSMLLNLHVGHKGKWIALSRLRDLAYPDNEGKNSTQAAMAKAIRPLYQNNFVEKKRDKSFVYVAATKRGRDAAKEAGLSQQAEKFDAAFAKLEG